MTKPWISGAGNLRQLLLARPPFAEHKLQSTRVTLLFEFGTQVVH